MGYKKELKRIKKEIQSPSKPLSQPNNHRPQDNICICKDKRGDFKVLYPSQAKAIEQAQEVWRSKGIKLKSYPCPDTMGWHLSRY